MPKRTVLQVTFTQMDCLNLRLLLLWTKLCSSKLGGGAFCLQTNNNCTLSPLLCTIKIQQWKNSTNYMISQCFFALRNAHCAMRIAHCEFAHCALRILYFTSWSAQSAITHSLQCQMHTALLFSHLDLSTIYCPYLSLIPNTSIMTSLK